MTTNSKLQKPSDSQRKGWLSLIGWVAVIPILGLLIGGVDGAIGLSLGFVTIASVWVFWIGSYAIGTRLAKRYGLEERFKMIYFIALGIFMFLLVGWLGSGGSVCPPGVYGDMICSW